MAEQPDPPVPPLSPVVPKCRIRPHRVYSLDRVHQITGLSRVVLQRLADTGKVQVIRTGKRSIAFGGIAVLILLGLPPPIPLPDNTTAETPNQRRARGERFKQQALKTNKKQR